MLLSWDRQMLTLHEVGNPGSSRIGANGARVARTNVYNMFVAQDVQISRHNH
jgi:hypothetical protein